jgi:membrane associated rhomboid family serine protease
MDKAEINKFLEAAKYPILLLSIVWAVKIIEQLSDISFAPYGLRPRSLEGIQGIITSVFIHSDWKHLFNNSVPLLILGWSLFYFYKEAAWKVILWVILMGGLWTWISARDSLHIGASGLLYGLFSFLLFSGFIRRNKQLLSISFLVAFLYGSLVWGLLPIDYRMSWESHFWGFMAGFALAIYYRKIGKQRDKHEWNDDEEELFEKMDYWKKEEDKTPKIKIIYKPKDDK